MHPILTAAVAITAMSLPLTATPLSAQPALQSPTSFDGRGLIAPLPVAARRIPSQRPARRLAEAASTLAGIATMERSRGPRERRAELGAKIGAATALVAGIAAIGICERNTEGEGGPPCAVGILGLPFYTGAGAVIGAFIGYAWPVD